MDFDSFYVKLGGVDDDGCIDARVIVGFSNEDVGSRYDVEVPVRFEADLSLSLREVREQAKIQALDFLQKASMLLEQHSSDELHQIAQEQFEKSSRERLQELQSKISGNHEQ